jgi:hypothetical protein
MLFSILYYTLVSAVITVAISFLYRHAWWFHRLRALLILLQRLSSTCGPPPPPHRLGLIPSTPIANKWTALDAMWSSPTLKIISPCTNVCWFVDVMYMGRCRGDRRLQANYVVTIITPWWSRPNWDLHLVPGNHAYYAAMDVTIRFC